MNVRRDPDGACVTPMVWWCGVVWCVYKGTIRRTAFEYKGNIFVHTQGVGINKAFNLPENIATRPGFEFAASQNDYAGALAFKALDQQIVKAVAKHRAQGW